MFYFSAVLKDLTVRFQTASVRSRRNMRSDTVMRKDALTLLNKASYLEPRFHRLIHLVRDKQQEVHEKVIRTVIVEEEEDEEGEEGAAMVMETQRQEKTALSAMGFIVNVQTHRVVLWQLELYYSKKCRRTLPTNNNPMSWWKKSRSKYSHPTINTQYFISILAIFSIIHPLSVTSYSLMGL